MVFQAFLHLKNNLSSQVIKLAMDVLNEFMRGKEMLVIPGNHDYVLWSSEPVLLELFQLYIKTGSITVITKPTWIDNFYCEPYTRKIAELNERLQKLEVPEGSIFLGHQDIKGANYGGFVVEHGLDPDLLSKKFKMSFIGHCHDAYMFRDNVFSIGAPMQHSFNDVGQPRGWWLWDLDSNQLEQQLNDFSPQFHDWYFGKDKIKDSPADFDRDFFRVTIEGVNLPDEVKKLKWKRVNFISEEESKQRISIQISDSFGDALEKYVEVRGGNLNHEKLMEIGRKYI